jgi:hypothetical protein
MNKYNLLELLDGHIEIMEGEVQRKVKLDGIKIPIIQRDYVQGRESESIVRNRFLSAIFNALEEGAGMELDFVYGSIKVSEANLQVFVPLDGQQRLTTLYLLNWYIGNRELEGEELLTLQNKLLRFSYSTRATAESFCEYLATVTFKDNPVEVITNSAWFHKRFELDPTVVAMLTMLGEVHKRYEKLGKALYENISNLKFYILPLDGFDLTDELYIKMNARGKQLTDFENFKADLNGWMISDLNPLKNELNTDVEYHSHNIPHYLRILSKFDNEWTNPIWTITKEEEDDADKVIDKPFLRFISRFILTAVIDGTKNSAQDIEGYLAFRHFYATDDNRIKYNSFDMYQKSFESSNTLLTFEKILDAISENYEEIIDALNPSWNRSDSWSFYDEKITQQQRIVFFGVYKYLESNTYEADSFRQWIRVVWNLAIDPDIRSIGAMINNMKLISELSAGSNNIYEFCESDAYQQIIDNSSKISSLQLKEERIKAKLLLDDKWKYQLMEAESHLLFQGNIRFLIDDHPTIEVFSNRLSNAKTIFDSTGSAKVFRSDYGIFRYMICKLDSWNEIQFFDYTDSFDNWQLLLRRKKACRTAVRQLCDVASIDLLHAEIEANITSPSQITNRNELDYQQLTTIHTNLYIDELFFTWMQKNGLRKGRWLYNHFFIVRPNAWYDKVMIDCYRNELINEIAKVFNIEIPEGCGDSNYFKGEYISIRHTLDDRTFRFTFNTYKTFEIEEYVDNADPLLISTYDYTLIKSNSDLSLAIGEILSMAAENNYPELTPAQ